MGDNILTLSFTLPLNSYVDFRYNDSCTVFGEVYKVNQVPVYQKGEGHRYTLTMHGEYYDLTKAQYLFLGSNNTLTQAEFYYTGTALDFLKLLLQNANRVNGYWMRGDVVTTSYKTLSFSRENCLEALQRIAEAFGTEWWVEGKTIHLSRRRTASGLYLKYGEAQALLNITRQPLNDTRIVTRLYPVGSNKNLPPNYRGGKSNLTLPGGVAFIEQNVDLYGVSEASVVFEDIFPHRTGKVTATGDPFTVYDASLNFDINQQLAPGLDAKITFNTGQLGGNEFKIQSYNASTKEIRFLKNAEETSIELPNETLRPAIGDEYVLTGIIMPQVYVDKGEKDVAISGETLLSKTSRPQYSYAVDLNEINIKGRNVKIELGAEVQIDDTNLGRVERIAVTRRTRYVLQENKYAIEVGESTKAGPIARLQSGQATTERQVREITDAVDTTQRTQNRFVGAVYLDGLPVFADEAAATTGGLTTGMLYRTPTGEIRIKL